MFNNRVRPRTGTEWLLRKQEENARKAIANEVKARTHAERRQRSTVVRVNSLSARLRKAEETIRNQRATTLSALVSSSLSPSLSLSSHNDRRSINLLFCHVLCAMIDVRRVAWCVRVACVVESTSV